MIPKIIHQIWLDQSKKMPETVINCIKSVREMNPTFEHRLWTYDDIDYINSIISEKALYGVNILKSIFEDNSNKSNVFISDIYRVALASKFGGLYVDSDIWARKPFPEKIFSKKLFLVIPVPGAKWITNGIFGMEKDSTDVSESVFDNCKPGFRPTPTFFTSGLMSWAGKNDNNEGQFPAEILIDALEPKGAIVDSKHQYFHVAQPSEMHDPICVHLAMASWHDRDKSKFYKHKILHEEPKLHLSNIYKD